MKNVFFITLGVLLSTSIWAQSIAINTTGDDPDASAILDISSDSKGVLIPRMTTDQRQAIFAPQDGLLVFDMDTRSFWFFSGNWNELITGDDMGTAGGDLIGQYPEPIVAKLQGHAVTGVTPSNNQVLKWDAPNNMWKGMKDSLSLPYIASAQGPGHVFSVTNSFNGFVNTTAIHGQRIDPSGITPDASSAIWGDAYIGTGVLGTSSFHPGVYGKSLQANGIEGYTLEDFKAGVLGFTAAPYGVGVRGISQNGYGIEGTTHDESYSGVYGTSSATLHSVGVLGKCHFADTTGIGVYGQSMSNNNGAGGVVGWNGKPGGIGVNGRAPFGHGIYGLTQSINYAGVRGYNEVGGKGIYGTSSADWFGEYTPIGVQGTVYASYEGNYGYGILGTVVGDGDGVRGYSGSSGHGIAGYNNEDGGGSAGYFEISSTSSSAKAVEIKHLGIGPSLFIDVENVNSMSPALLVQKNGNLDYAVFEDGTGVNKIRFDNNGKGFFNGGTQTGGADIAEVFDVEDDITLYEPGDVLAISVDKDRTVVKSAEPYSTLVAGVYATKPGVLMTEEHIDADLSGKVPMGVVGVIPTKVCLEGGDIRRGDLLVTSSLPGVAMKGDLDKIKTGQVLGKALENYSSAQTEKIRVLVNVK